MRTHRAKIPSIEPTHDRLTQTLTATPHPIKEPREDEDQKLMAPMSPRSSSLMRCGSPTPASDLTNPNTTHKSTETAKEHLAHDSDSLLKQEVCLARVVSVQPDEKSPKAMSSGLQITQTKIKESESREQPTPPDEQKVGEASNVVPNLNIQTTYLPIRDLERRTPQEAKAQQQKKGNE